MPQFGQTKKPLLCKRFRSQDLRSDAPSAAGTALRCKRFQTEASEILPEKLVLERVLGSEAGFVAAKNSKNGLKSTFCPQDTLLNARLSPRLSQGPKN